MVEKIKKSKAEASITVGVYYFVCRDHRYGGIDVGCSFWTV